MNKDVTCSHCGSLLRFESPEDYEDNGRTIQFRCAACGKWDCHIKKDQPSFLLDSYRRSGPDPFTDKIYEERIASKQHISSSYESELIHW